MNDKVDFPYIKVYQDNKNRVRYVARLLCEPHSIAYFYLFGKLNKVLDCNISDSDKIKTAVSVLEEVIILQEIFADVIPCAVMWILTGKC